MGWSLSPVWDNDRAGVSHFQPFSPKHNLPWNSFVTWFYHFRSRSKLAGRRAFTHREGKQAVCSLLEFL